MCTVTDVCIVCDPAIADYGNIVNECNSTSNGGCDQRCVDTNYSYMCSCDPGYELDLLNRRECNGECCLVTHPYLELGIENNKMASCSTQYTDVCNMATLMDFVVVLLSIHMSPFFSCTI